MQSTTQRAQETGGANQPDKSFAVSAPAISLPKGGGAIRGICEKFAANFITGSRSAGRSGVGSQLNLSYYSGSGNSPFGLGWSLLIPSITRKTDKGLPKYQDAENSDIFILSGAENVVPEFKKDKDHILKAFLLVLSGGPIQNASLAAIIKKEGIKCF